MKRFASILFFSLFISGISRSQLLSWTPGFPVENDGAGTVVITMDATKGNQGLLNYTPTTDVYVHIGIITTLSTGPSDWKHVPFTWGTTNAAAQCSYLGSNKWKYTITGSLRTFFNITDANEHIKKIAILFRNGTGSQAQRNADGSDMYVPVYDNNLAVRFDLPLMQPFYVPIPEPISVSVGGSINITGVTNKVSTMKLYLNGSTVQTASSVTTISANPTITIGGNQELVVEANDGTTTKTDTIHFYVPPAINIAPLPPGVRDGINYGSNNTSATLVLYAPSKNRVSIIGEFPGSNWTEQLTYQMNKTPDGNYWWLTITGLTAGTEYAFQYIVDGTLKVAEPYSEKILDPSNDGTIPSSTYPGLKPYPTGMTSGIVSILQTAEPQYTWGINNFNRPDKRNLIIYEMLLRDFLATHDWNTFRDTLNYLKNLGVTAIEIMPFNEFEGNSSWGYNPDFFFAPDKYYGPKNTLKRFIDSCHAKGIAVIMDIVLNHATGLCPLAALYWDNVNNRPAANNPWFNPVATHPFNVFNDFNHESLATRYFTSRVVEHWLQNYKLDGFRFDLSKGFTQFNSGTNVNLWSQYDASRVAIWKRYYDTLQLKSPGSYVILEHFADNTEELELSNYGMMFWGNLNYNYGQAAMGYTTDWDFSYGIFTARNWTKPHLITYMESHDEERLMYKNLQFGNVSGGYNIKDPNTALKRMEMCGAFLFTIPGPKMIWEFGEMGYDYSINRCTDGSINNNCRLDPKPIQWDYLQNIQRKRLYDIYSALLKLRNHNLYRDAFMSDRITWNLSGPVKSIKVTTDTSNLLAIGNFDLVQQTGAVVFQNAGTWYDYLSGVTFSATGTSQNMTLQPGEYHVYLSRNVVNAVTTPVITVNPANKDFRILVYPNPVGNSLSNIEVEVPSNGKAAIDLWNSLGQKIATVYSGLLTKGVHTIPFAQGNKKLPAGSYLLRLQQNNKTETVQFILQ